MSFPADIKGCMKDCILSLFWPRKDIVGFFEKHGCTKAEVASLQIEGENALKRHEVVDALFKSLAARPDYGLGPFRAMLQSLLTWSHFDPYYFDKLGKLDRTAANKSLEHLRQLQEIRDAKIKADSSTCIRSPARRRSSSECRPKTMPSKKLSATTQVLERKVRRAAKTGSTFNRIREIFPH